MARWTKGVLGAALLPILMWVGQAGSPVWAAEPPPVTASTLSIDDLWTQARAGHAPSQYQLGGMLAEGRGVVRNQREAVAWYTQAAEQGLADAQQALGFMLVNGGIGVTRDVPEGLRWLYAAAQQGQPLAISWYRQGAESGYPPAQYTLGLLHAKGQGVAKDDQAALSWYRKAAEQGWPDAQYALGRRLEAGDGVPKDEQAAAALYFNAARQDHVDAQLRLGWMLDQIGRDKEAASWYLRAAHQGNLSAQYNLGVMFHSGEGVPVNLEQAEAWYRRAAEQGHANAQNELGRLLAGGFFRDDEAAHWFRKAAAQGHVQAKQNLEKLAQLKKSRVAP